MLRDRRGRLALIIPAIIHCYISFRRPPMGGFLGRTSLSRSWTSTAGTRTAGPDVRKASAGIFFDGKL